MRTLSDQECGVSTVRFMIGSFAPLFIQVTGSLIKFAFFLRAIIKKKAARYDRNQCLGWKTINVLLEKTKPWNLVHATWTLAVYVIERDLELLK